MSLVTDYSLQLPAWIETLVDAWKKPLGSDEDGMWLAIALATENVRQHTGGPFGAAVIDEAAGKLVSVGVNLVTESNLSIAHAEIIALSLAQQRLGDWNLARDASLTLVTTCEPCAMCCGALPWSGIRRLVCGARKDDAEKAGFDEGAKPQNWIGSLHKRGISVTMNVLRDEANSIFHKYATRGGVIYNAGPDNGA